MSVPVVPARAARRLLLLSQGLLADPARRAAPAAVYRLIETMGFVQVDTINVVERAHQHILYSRLDDYRPAMLVKLLERDRKLFEHWTHDAAVIPSTWFPQWRPRFTRFKSEAARRPGWRRRLGGAPRAVIRRVRERIEREGPLMSRDFETERRRPGGGWWDWKPEKAALEYLWRAGELAVSGRRNFQKIYDLVERTIPQARDARSPGAREHSDWVCRTSLERLGVATPIELARFLASIDLSAAKRWCQQAARRGEILEVSVEAVDGSKPRGAYARLDWERRARGSREPPERVRLLSPFDPVIRDRDRTRRLFGFDYAFEAFVPAARRRYGYYVLPLLEGERLIGRVDPKLHRDRGVLEIRGLWWEPGVSPTRDRLDALESGLARFARQIGAHDFALPARGSSRAAVSGAGVRPASSM